MNPNPTRIFLDTAYVLALLNPRDTYHNRDKQLLFQLRTTKEVWVKRREAIGTMVYRCTELYRF